MPSNYQRFISIFLYVLFAIALVFAIFFYFGKVVPGTKGTQFEEPVITDKFLILAYIYFGIAAILAIVFPLEYIITHPKKVKNVLLSILIFVVVLVIGYLMGSGQQLDANSDISTTTMRLVDSGLKITYIFLGVAFLGVIFSEVSSIFR